MSRPNIVFILSDQHNVLKEADTPNLDRLESDGVSFANTFCSSPLCVPSRAGLLTGTYPTHNGVWNNVQALNSDRVTLPQCLALNGYRTALAGRMHFNFQDQNHGYDEHLVGEITPTYPRPERQAAVYGCLKGTPDQSYVSIEKSGAGHSSVHDYDKAVADAANRYIADHKNDGPYFLTVGFYGPHCPFVAESSLYAKYYERFSTLKADRSYDSLHPGYQHFIDLRGIRDLTDEERRRTAAAYYANVEYMDSLIGSILKTIESESSLENTIVIYSSDHGESLGHHGLYWKSNFYRESVNVPLIFSWKNHIGHRVVNENISLIDLAPTLLDLTGSKSLPDADGISLKSILEGGEAKEDRYIYSMLEDLKGDDPSAMVVKGEYKLIKFCNNDDPILFDRNADPFEKRDLGKEPEYQNVKTELLKKLGETWDESVRMEELSTLKIQAALLKEWIKSNKPEVKGEWPADASSNFLLKEKE